MINEQVFSIFFREKPAMMLVQLKNSKGAIYASALAKLVDCTYSHVVKVLHEMERSGLVTFDKKGRLKLLTMTPKGREMATHIEAVRQLLC